MAKPQEIGLSIFGFFENIISGSIHAAGDFYDSIGNLTELQSKYDKAVIELKKIEGSERALVKLREENRRLREQLQFHQALTYFNVPVEVIGKDPSQVYSTFIVNKGYLDGIRKNMPVVATQSGTTGLVGKVTQVGLTTSVVQPILDPSLYIASRIENTRNEGLVNGKSGNEEKLNLSYVKKTAANEILTGDLVVTAGVDSIYPPDIIIGRVKEVTSKEYQTSLDIDIDPILDFSRLEYLSILRSEP